MRVPGSRTSGRAGLLGLLALSVAGCYDPSKPSEVAPFVIELLVGIFAFIIVITFVSLYFTRSLMKNVMGGMRAGMGGFAGPGGTGTVPGIPSEATITSIADTGITMSMPGLGANSPRYGLGLSVMPVDGSTQPYLVQITTQVPRIFVPMIVPGAQVPVLVDPNNPGNVHLDFTRMGQVPRA